MGPDFRATVRRRHVVDGESHAQYHEGILLLIESDPGRGEGEEPQTMGSERACVCVAPVREGPPGCFAPPRHSSVGAALGEHNRVPSCQHLQSATAHQEPGRRSVFMSFKVNHALKESPGLQKTTFQKTSCIVAPAPTAASSQARRLPGQHSVIFSAFSHSQDIVDIVDIVDVVDIVDIVETPPLECESVK